jgi:hypothetical protein
MPDAAIQLVGAALLRDLFHGHLWKDGPWRQLGMGTNRVFRVRGQGDNAQQGEQGRPHSSRQAGVAGDSRQIEMDTF